MKSTKILIGCYNFFCAVCFLNSTNYPSPSSAINIPPSSKTKANGMMRILHKGMNTSEFRIGIVLILLFNSCLSYDKSNEVARNVRDDLIIRLNNIIDNEEHVVKAISGKNEVVILTSHSDGKRTFYYVVPFDSTETLWKTNSPINSFIEETPGWDRDQRQLFCTSKFGGKPLYSCFKSNEEGSWKALPGLTKLPFSFHGINVENGNLFCNGYMDGIFTISLDSNRSYIHDESEPGDSRYSCKAIGPHESLSIVSGCWNDSEVAVLCLNQKLDSIWSNLYEIIRLSDVDPFRVKMPISLVVDDSICMIATGNVLECRSVEDGKFIWSRILEGYSCNMIRVDGAFYVMTYNSLTKENYFYSFHSNSPSSFRKSFSYFAEGPIEMVKYHERIILYGNGKLLELVSSNNTYRMIEVFAMSEERREVLTPFTDQISGDTRFILESEEQ